LDPNAFTPDVVEILMSIGNRVSNMVWEAKLDQNLKPSSLANREQRLKFISSKYSDRIYVQPLGSGTLSHYHTPDEMLLASVKKNDIQNVNYALALKANANAHDRSRSTHAVHLALAAADPASPASAVSASGSPKGSGSNTPPTTSSRKPFAIAELLLINGAELPTQPAPFPLSTSARLYLEQKAAARAGTAASQTPLQVPVFREPAGRASAEGDALTALPDIRAGNGSTPSERAREREKLLKRGNSGARLVKSHGS